MPSAPEKFDVVMLSTADWDNPFWTNKQHVASELARLGHRILYIESPGLRRPTATKRDMGRIFSRLKSGLRPPRKVSERIWVLSPLLVPFNGYPIVRHINKLILTASVFVVRKALDLKDELFWTYSPLTTKLLKIPRGATLVYHCVDDVKHQPGMPAELILEAEKDLAEKSDIIFVTAPELRVKLLPFNKYTVYYPNVADFSHFNAALREDLAIPADFVAIPAPRIGFIGAISSYKLDIPLLAAAARLRPSYSFVLIGDIGEGDPYTNVDELKNFENIYFLGQRPYSDLPAYLAAFDVAMLPSAINDYTKSMFPMKFFEYLASGTPVVSTRLAALEGYAEVAEFASTSDEFVSRIDSLLSGDGASIDVRLAAARGNTYESRTAKMLADVANVRR